MAAPQPGIEGVVVDPVPFGKYLLLDMLGEGRTGPVYRACLRREGKSDKLLAIKRVGAELAHDAAFAERFLQVMERAIQLEHPAHCSLEEYDRDEDGTPYVAMALVAGKDLWRLGTELAERGELFPPQLLGYIGSQIAAALSAAHRMARFSKPAPLFHGQLSPRDILIGYDGRVLLTGLGSAILHGPPPPDSELARYESPERRLGAPPSASSDVYALGMCMYELLGGQRPHESRRGTDSHIRAAVPRPLDEVVRRAIAEAPEARWDGAAELAAALQRWTTSQPARGDARALAAFMQLHFGDECAEDERIAQSYLARIPASAPRLPQAAPAAALPGPRVPTYPQLVRANERSSARPNPPSAPMIERVELKPSASRPPQPEAAAEQPPRAQSRAPGSRPPSEPKLPAAAQAPAAPRSAPYKVQPAKPAQPKPPTAAANPWGDPAERTPAHGVLMSQLAAEMNEAAAAAAAEPSAPATAALPQPESFAEDDNWDDLTPANRWISSAEEAAANEKPRTSSVRVVAPQLRKPAPLPYAPPARAAEPQRAALPLPAAPAPVAAAGESRKRVLLIAGGAAALLIAVVAAIAGTRHASGGTSALQVDTHPAGAEVYVRGELIGTTPLERRDLAEGSATLELHAAGFETVVRKIHLTKGAPVSLDVDLVRRTAPAAAPVAPAPAVVAAPDEAATDAVEARDDRQPSSSERRWSPRRRSADDEAAVASAPVATGALGGDQPPAPEASAVETGTAAASPDGFAGLRMTPQPAEPAPRPSVEPAGRPLDLTPAPIAAKPTAPAPSPAPAPAARPAVLVDKVVPRFPARARRMDITTGFVSIEYTIARDGSVKDAKVVESEPSNVFDKAALDAIEKWKYQPKLENGQPVESRQRMKFRFAE